MFLLHLLLLTLAMHDVVYKGNSNITLFENLKSIEKKKTNPGYKLKLRDTHQI